MANEEQLVDISRKINVEMNRLPPDSRQWINLFKRMDEDGSGLITYDEMERTIREMLRMSAEAIPKRALQGLWLKLDENRNGSIDAGEFGRFMRKALGAERTKV